MESSCIQGELAIRRVGKQRHVRCRFAEIVRAHNTELDAIDVGAIDGTNLLIKGKQVPRVQHDFTVRGANDIDRWTPKWRPDGHIQSDWVFIDNGIRHTLKPVVWEWSIEDEHHGQGRVGVESGGRIGLVAVVDLDFTFLDATLVAFVGLFSRSTMLISRS